MFLSLTADLMDSRSSLSLRIDDALSPGLLSLSLAFVFVSSPVTLPAKIQYRPIIIPKRGERNVLKFCTISNPRITESE